MLALLVYLLVILIVAGIAWWIVGALVPAPFQKPALAVLALIVLIMILGLVFGWFPAPSRVWWRGP